MTIVDTATGELIEPMTAQEAERITHRITLRLGTMADNYEAVMPMIRDAILREAHRALGYPSPGAYVSERFGESLSRLGVEMRREVVRELTDAGMSTRAIAPVVGVTHKTVVKDLQVVPEVPPVIWEGDDLTVISSVDDAEFEAVLTEAQNEGDASRANVESKILGARPITGLDGKTYTRPTSASRAPQRRSLVDTARDAGQELRKATERLERIAADDRLTRNKEEVAAHLRHHLNRAIEVCQDLDNLLNNH